MQRLWQTVLACLLLIVASVSGLLPVAHAEPASAGVYVIPVENEIETGLAVSLQRAFDQAREKGAKAVLLDINTLGGRIDAAMEIGQLIRSADVPVIAYIRGQAISAGAYLAMNADHIAMAPGSTIGAAEARSTDGEPADPKVQAFWRSEMISAAEFTGRDSKLAAGMVDRNVEIPGFKQKGELVSLSANQAVEKNIADGIYQDRQSVLTR
jgi:membrane-bound serine protease (ClpP class)